MNWAAEEFATIVLGDKRLDQRAVLLAERLGQNPFASIPAACDGWHETQGACRFLKRPSVGWEALLQPHWDCAQQRMQAHRIVLCIQDTTELDYQGQDIDGLGPLSYEAQRGFYLHPSYAITPEREPLGVLDAWMWAREFKNEEGVREGVKESQRWLESYQRLAEQAAQLPDTRLVNVADRESDILALLVKARDLGHPLDYLIHSQHNRALPDGRKLWDSVAAAPLLGHVRFELPAGRGRKVRHVEQEIRARRVTLTDGHGGEVPVTCLEAAEINTPEGCKPVIWRLLSNREAGTLEAAVELIDWYRARWEIELFFLILKEGCRVEQLQLSTLERLESALALYLVIAWRINRLMRLGRTLPELDADLLFAKEEWQAAYILNKKHPPKATPPRNEVIRLIARRGGFLGRKHDGDPGAKTIWLDLQEIAVFVEGMRFARLSNDG